MTLPRSMVIAFRLLLTLSLLLILYLATIKLENPILTSVNDKLGHEEGDELLRLVGETIQKNTRLTDIPARVGGDEFVILLTNTDKDGARISLERLRSAFYKVMEEHSWPVTFSMGVITYYEVPIAVSHMVKRADNLMYQAKRAGKNIIKYEEIEEVLV